MTILRKAGIIIAGLSCMLIMFTGCTKKQETPDSSASTSSSTPPPPVNEGFPVTVNDVTIQTGPVRVAVLSPSLAEIAVDMGFAPYVAVRSDECNQPEQVAALPSAGSMLNPDADFIKEMKPDLVLMQAEPDETFRKSLGDAGVPLVVIPPAQTLEEIETVYNKVGLVFGGSVQGAEKAQKMNDTLRDGIEDIRQRVSSQKEKVAAVYATDAYGHAATGDTLIHELMTVAGLNNSAASGTHWNLPQNAGSKAAILFCPSNAKSAIAGDSRYSQSPAVRNKKIIVLEDTALQRQGLALIDAVKAMASAAYPSAFSN